MPDDASYSIAERQAIRRAADASLQALGLPCGQATLVEAESCLGLLRLLTQAKVPLRAECYDLSSFNVQSLTFTKPNLLRLSDDNGDQRVCEISSGLVLYFPETVGQAPIIYVESQARPIQPHLYLREVQLDEWSRPIQYHEALLRGDTILYSPEEILTHKRAELTGEQAPLPEILSYISAGIAFAFHVAPRTFSYRFPEYALTQIAHWPIEDLCETLQETMERMIRTKEGMSDTEPWN